MIKINLLGQKKPFKLPIILGMDLNHLSLKWLLVAIIIKFVVDIFGSQYIQTGEQEELAKIEQMQSQLNQLSSDVSSHGDLKLKLDAFRQQVTKLQERSEQVDKILKQKKNPRQILERLARNLPEDLWFEKLEINKDSEIHISGKSISYKSIGDFILMANDSPFFGKQLTITKGSTVEETDGPYTRRVESFEVQGKIETYDPWGGK